MPKFKVYADKSVDYTIDVEASDEEAAEAEAKRLLEEAAKKGELSKYEDSDNGFEILEAVPE